MVLKVCNFWFILSKGLMFSVLDYGYVMRYWVKKIVLK